MRKKILSLAMIALSVQAFAQTPTWIADSIVQGPGYIDDSYYSMKSGIQKVENNRNWHLAFYMKAADQTAGIRANHTNGVNIFNPHKHISQLSTLSISDTATADIQYNSEISWTKGAFNQNLNTANPFSYGWGVYNMPSHNVYGDSIYFIKTVSGGWSAIVIDSLNGTTNDWYFRLYNISTSSLNSFTINKLPNYTNKMYAYFNLDSATNKDREPVDSLWDIQFTRYTSYVTLGPTTAWYPVTGVLTNQKVKAIRAQNIHVDTAYVAWANATNLASNLATMNSNINNIGWDYKIPQTTTVYNPDSNSYFILDRTSNLWQFRFTGFTTGSGGQNSKTNFEKRHVSFPLATKENINIERVTIFPIPATTEVNLVMDSKIQTNAALFITSINGQTVYQKTEKINQGLNAFKINTQSLSKGIYTISIRGNNIKLDTKMTIN